MVWDVGDANATHFIDYYEVAQKIRVGFPKQSHSAIRHNMDHKGPTQCVCVCVTDCYFIVNVLDLPFAFTYNDISQSMPINQY